MKSERLLSIDFFRGITMLLLIGEFTHMFTFMTNPVFEGGWVHFIGTQFKHHPWNGLRFWDLIQPFFMFIVGVAIPFSVRKRESRGDKEFSILRHALIRSALMLLLGWALYCIGPGKITFLFQNVLAQLAVTYMAAFLLRNQKNWIQLGATILILLFTEFLYRWFPVAGYDQAFTPDKNFGAWFDMLISGQLSGGHWVSFNAIPTIAHTVWGVLIGKVILSKRTGKQKLIIMLIAGSVGLLLGYGLNPVTPIIKRISTTTFVLASGGWSILALAFSYWLIDMKKYRNWTLAFAVVGMNPLFIYLFAHIGGSDLVYSVFKPFTFAIMSWTDEIYAQLFTSAVAWAFLWYICYWMWKKKLFIKI